MTTEKILFVPELERAYQEYRQLEKRRTNGSGDDNLILVLLGDPAYAARFKMSKWNIPVTMLQEPKVAIRHGHTLGVPASKAAHAERCNYFQNLGTTMAAANQDLAEFAYNKYGGKGPLVSGSLQSHFPATIKDRLRFLAHGLPIVADAVRLHEYLANTRSPQFR